MSDQAAPGLSLLLRASEQVIRQRLEPILRERGLTAEHGRIMSVLRADPGLTMSLLSRRAVLPKASLTRNVDALVELGIVVRRIHPDDRRRVVVALSPDGLALADALAEEERAIEQQLISALGDERFGDLTRDLAALPDALT